MMMGLSCEDLYKLQLVICYWAKYVYKLAVPSHEVNLVLSGI